MNAIFKILLFFVVGLFVVGCGQSGLQDMTSKNKKSRIYIPDVSYECSSDKNSEDSFYDYFVSEQKGDRAWNIDLTKKVTVDMIAAEFNAGREGDPTVSGKLIMPSQDVWDSYSDSQKALYLINSERCARGLRPFEGIDSKLSDEVATKYANFLRDHKAWGHEEDGRDPWQRMEEDGGIVVGKNADFFRYGEDLAFIEYGYSLNYLDVHESVAQSVYGWLYDDKIATNSHYGHRKFLFAKGLSDNFGSKGKEGLIGVGVSTLRYFDGEFYRTRVYTVLDGFDPNSNWN